MYSHDAPLQSVFINGRFLSQRVTGVQRYARESLAALDDLLATGIHRGIRWTLLVPPGTPPLALKCIRVKQVGHWNGHLWEQLELPWHARSGLLMSFCLTGPLLKKQQIITVHDASVARIPQAFKLHFRLWYRLLISVIVRRAPLTLTVSRFSAGEVAHCFGAPPGRLRVVTEGWQHLDRLTADLSVLERFDLQERPFVLAVSSPTPNKNFAAVAEALRSMGPDAPLCAVAGAADASLFESESRGAGGLVRLGYVSDEELKALYLHARCFVFPSFYEGFGIPPLEAMASGCPVIGSTAPAVREVCGDAALYFDPHRPDQLAIQLRRLFSDPVLRHSLSEAGRRRARNYSWSEAARLNLQYIREALVEPGRQPRMSSVIEESVE